MTKPSKKPLHAPTLHHLDQLMAGLLEGVILIDPTGVILSANPAALEMHGVAKLEDLGETADDYVARFSLRYRDHRRLPRRDYPLLRLLAGESFPDLIVEVAPANADEPRWVHQVRDIVMDEDGGEPDCLGLVINDVSERFDAEDRFEAMFHANPAPALILRVADQRFVLVNQGFLDLSGYARDAIIGRTLLDFDFLAEVDRKAFVRDCVAHGKVVPQLEAELPLAGGDTTLVVLAGQPIEVANQDCLLFTFADLEPRRRAERALQDSERHLASVFEMAPVAMVVTEGEDNRITQVNAAFETLTGYDDAAVIGRVADDLQLWNDAAQREGLEQEIAQRGGFRGHDVRLLHRNGDAADCLVSAERISMDGGPCVLWLYQDISTRRRSELELVEAIEAVMKDANWLSRSIMDKLATLRNPRTSKDSPATDLSKREREVLELICQDLDDAAIAERLGLSRNTVRNHVARLYAKIGVNRRSAAVVWAHERGVGG
ncbi:helix-turn-helix transcriptional regulator [Sphingomonas ginsenosidivorax]|uniref:Helix-turn-helix transcriptional regulator n=1 Tax=Sphingomonas ginsenosidivorax TaxID=862135 RepID=A0A5C6UE77_9SPHN|nr:helix-turn-helix transcriptional regulator [Sphingomonas ginsenosidivorax]TXC71042.1 helix-turn-helix transcriptional regulator [Sphingomonas ginsenosidivorax]